jgi:hypothetical protein
MTAASSPNPRNLLILAALGIGVYWFMTRAARAGTVTGVRAVFPTAAQNAQYAGYSAKDQALWGTIGGILNKGVNAIFSGPDSANPYYKANAAVAATQTATSGTSSSTGDPYNPDGGYYTSTVDALPFNPSGNVAPWDVITQLGD